MLQNVLFNESANRIILKLEIFRRALKIKNFKFRRSGKMNEHEILLGV